MGADDDGIAAEPAASNVLQRLRAEPVAAGPTSLVTFRRLARTISGLPVGQRLPSERRLADAAGVSRQTLRNALASLEQDGLVHAEAHRGWFVARPSIHERANSLQSFSELAAAEGLTAGAVVLDAQVRTGTVDECAELGIATSSTVFVLRRVRTLDDDPIGVETNVFSPLVADRLSTLDWTDRSVLGTLEDDAVDIGYADYVVHAGAADADTAELLDVQIGAATLTGRSVTYDTTHTPIYIGTTIYRGDSYRFSASLFR